jgi:diguanylate cyclase (GGDEF)-like protein/PAS domain S-box-containing protein
MAMGKDVLLEQNHSQPPPFQALVETSPLAICCINPSGVCTYINSTCIDLLGYTTAQEILGQSIHNLIGDHSGQLDPTSSHACLNLDDLRHTPTHSVSHGFRRKDGNYVPVEYWSRPLMQQHALICIQIVFQDISTRKRAEQHLQHDRQLLAASQQIMHLGSYEFNLLTNEHVWSDEIARIHGLNSAEEWNELGSMMQLIEPGDQERLAAYIQATLAEYRNDPIEYCIVRPNGERRQVRFEPRFEYDEQGVPHRLIGALLDVTDIRLAEQERARLVQMLEATPDIVSIADTDGKVLYLNPAGARLFRMTRSKWYGRHTSDFFTPEAAATLHQHAIPAARRKGVWSGETVLKGANNCEIPGSQVLIAHSDGNGTVTHFSTIIRDLRRQKRMELALRENEQRLRQIAETIPQMFWLIELNEAVLTGLEMPHFLYVSPAFERLTGYRLHEVEDPYRTWQELIHPEDQPLLIDLLPHFCEREATIEYRIRRRDGAERTVCAQVMPVRDREGRVYRIAGLIEDITARKQAEQHLQQAAVVFENSLEGVMITDADNRIIAVNRAFSEITGYSEAEAIGADPVMLRSNRHDHHFFQRMWSQIHETGRWQGEVWNRRKNGEVYPQWMTISTIRDDAGATVNYIGVFADISATKQSEQQLERMAHYDNLTGLPNWLLLSARLDHALGQAQRYGHKVAVLFLDLERFKNINDSLGHPAGDELLIAIGQRLQDRIRKVDTLARLGGDEFIICLENIPNAEAAALTAQQLLDMLADPFKLSNGHEVFTGGSIGISLYPDDADDSTRLIRNADTAMYQAKAHGGGTYRFYTAAMTRIAHERLDLEGKLRRAIEQEEFVLYYQPQIDALTNRIIGVEALIRWQHPERGLISPGLFIPIAEETGLIMAISDWTMRTACVQMQAWRERGVAPMRMSVNLSPRQFQDKQLAAKIRNILYETGLPASWLELEITEGSTMADPEQAVVTIKELKQLGAAIAIDDFGTGYSSLAYLQRYEIDRLKIDRSFIKDLPHSANDAAIVNTIIATARALRLQVLAEGVETNEQLAFLRGYGCDAYQGYLYSRPEPAAVIEERLFVTVTIN